MTSPGDDQSAIVDIMIWIYLFVCCFVSVILTLHVSRSLVAIF